MFPSLVVPTAVILLPPPQKRFSFGANAGPPNGFRKALWKKTSFVDSLALLGSSIVAPLSPQERRNWLSGCSFSVAGMDDRRVLSHLT